MKPLSDRMLAAYAAGALEPGDALAVERALAARPGLQARLDALAPVSAPTPGPTPLPGMPPAGPWLVGATGGISLGALHLDASGPGGAATWRPGDRLSLRLSGEMPGEARLFATLHDRTGETVLSDGRITVDRLRRDGDAWVLDLVLADVPGLHRLVVEVRAPSDEQVLARAELGVRVTTG